MERLTYDFCIGGNHCWQVKGADNLECREVCERQGDAGCKTCPIAKAFDRLAAYEDTGLEPEEIRSQKELFDYLVFDSTPSEDIERFKRLRELAEADREGRCVVFAPGYPVVSAYYSDEDGIIRPGCNRCSYRGGIQGRTREKANMSDYISRDELLELYAPDPDCDKGSVPFPVVRQNILDMPAADVAPVEHGHWNDINPAVLKPGISWVCRCSLCGCPQDYKHNYCPNCGAKMDKEDE